MLDIMNLTKLKKREREINKEIKMIDNKKDKISEKDVGYMEDLVTNLLNLLHAEWHSTKSYFMTNDEDWLKISNELRIDRSKLLELITKKDNSEIWCWNKHILISIGGYIELANREMTSGNQKKSIEYLNLAKKWLGVFYVKNNIEGGEK